MSSTTPAQPKADELARVEQLLAHFEQIEAEFEQVREGLTHSHRLVTLGTIATTIAHEYNNILTPIISYAQMALAKPDDSEFMLKALQKSLAGAERAAAISSSLLGFSRSGDKERTANLTSTIEQTIGCLARDPRKDGIDLLIDVPQTHVSMSPLNLQQVLLNLILNAKQAMRRKGGSLRITGYERDGDVYIDVADSGPGIPQKIMDRLFEPFVTARSSDDEKGTGLGLCICRDLVRNAGGTITVDSIPDKGATFHIRLPKADDGFETT